MRIICILGALMRQVLIIFFVTTVLLAITGCGACARTDTEQSGKINVAVTIVPEKTFVEAVGKDLVNVVCMVPPGSSPETYEPTAAQMQEFSTASLYFAIGVPVEAAGILEKAGDTPGMKVIRLQDEAAQEYPERAFAPGEKDPHVWLSPRRAKVMASAIARELALADPAHKDTYEANAKAYIAQLDALDKRIAATLAGAKNKTFIVFHPAFGYLADDYGLTMVALEEEGKEATPQHLQEVIDLARTKGIRTVFYQEEIDSRQSWAFAEEIGGKAVLVRPLAADYAENLENMAKAIAEGSE